MTDAVMVGWGHTRFGKMDALSIEDLIVAAAKEAISDAGISPGEIDGMWLGQFNSGLIPDGFCAPMLLGAAPELRFKPATRCENACASGATALYAAINAIDSGRAKIALVVGAEKMTSQNTEGVTRALAGASYQPEEQGISFPGIFAGITKAYAERYCDPGDALAHIAAKNHKNAMDNPLAHFQRLLGVDFCRQVSDKNPLIADPLKLSDCSPISDGAAALILAHKDLLGDFKRAVGFRAVQHVTDLLPISRRDVLAFEGPRRAIGQAYAEAGISVKDLDFAEVHDCFTIAELLATEALGLAEPGKGGEVVCAGETGAQGRLPINRSGGLKAKGHPVGATGVSMHVMSSRQLIGEAGALQIPNAELGLCFNMGGAAVANCVSVLEPIKT
jgi:acetyl-CoA C-acetyltransferase